MHICAVLWSAVLHAMLHTTLPLQPLHLYLPSAFQQQSALVITYMVVRRVFTFFSQGFFTTFTADKYMVSIIL